MSEHMYNSDFTLEDFHQLVKDLENDYERERKRRNKLKDNSFFQIRLIAQKDGGSLYKLDNGMFVSPNWCREYLIALDAWEKNNFESKLILKADK